MTRIEIAGTTFHVDGRIANEGRRVRGIPIDGLLVNSRMINGIFDDLNADTSPRWAYPDTGRWDAERNVSEFIAAMPTWRERGLDAFTVGIQGGSPQGYSEHQPWDTGGFDPDGSLRPAFADRLRRVLDEADRQGLVVIVDYFYQGQENRLEDEAAVRRATEQATGFLLDGGWRNVLVEIANECNFEWEYTRNRILRWERVHELIALAQSIERDGRRLLVSTSFAAIDPILTTDVALQADWILLHGNGTDRPERLTEMVAEVRRMPGYARNPRPIMFNEDDHFDFDRPENHMTAALRAGASWGYFDPGSDTVLPPKPTIGNYRDGFQAMPVDWGIASDTKRAFFDAISAPI
jgi:hypothetical protein